MPQTDGNGNGTPEPDEGLERRLRALEDKEALRDLLMRGWHALDRKDWASWSACWARDAVLRFGPWEEIHGREAIAARVREAEAPYPAMQHHILNLHTEVAGDRAAGAGYMWFVAVDAPGARSEPYAMGGPYAWEFHRTGSGWLLARQELGVWWTSGTDTRGAFR
ncbi:DUF4440 domain-containing protein [Streptomyces sp. ZEA17I]|uniref:nuclear transport factor 2 family protein n=1 Tax=Streptomyces sp. ZEA17I TaxID=2202516 RepID=UPI000D6F8918|nr:nuclear transport factor 2 family protein [Streptomyces sp. ZEA17I]PWS43344.1 DUF4440 domain-containing protein [Streptomyces sp. ZEA17I]